MNNLLEKICANKKKEIEENKKKCSLKSLEKILQNLKIEKRSFKKLLINSQKNKKNFIIGEIKKSSPSAGNIIKDYNPNEIALTYEKSGIGALSILTDIQYFEGNIEHISIIKKSSNLPILRKDFIIDPYQILQSKIYFADAILLILSILDNIQIKEFVDIAKNYNLDCLIEVHTKNELERAIDIGYPVIGINNRNLNTLHIDDKNSINLLTNIPKEFIIVAESGISSNDQIRLYNEKGIYNFLIGESILKSENKQKKINNLLGYDHTYK